jgi:DNA-directed RNA polymerase subunit RPC12/RpoP
MSDLDERIWDLVEELVKSKCVRCGTEVSGGSKGSRCKSCMDKLTRLRHTAGTKERAWRKADDATRRQKGKNGTAPGTSKGNGDWSDIADRHQRAEKKNGQKLSPDRKDNSEGYSGKNTRAIPEHLNRGRHNADEKKIKEWKKRLKKAEITEDELAALLYVRFEENSSNGD